MLPKSSRPLSPSYMPNIIEGFTPFWSTAKESPPNGFCPPGLVAPRTTKCNIKNHSLQIRKEEFHENSCACLALLTAFPKAAGWSLSNNNSPLSPPLRFTTPARPSQTRPPSKTHTLASLLSSVPPLCNNPRLTSRKPPPWLLPPVPPDSTPQSPGLFLPSSPCLSRNPSEHLSPALSRKVHSSVQLSPEHPKWMVNFTMEESFFLVVVLSSSSKSMIA